MKYSPNGRALDKSITSVGRGTLYIMELDEFDRPIKKTMKSLGYNNSISIGVSKDQNDKTHTNFDKTVTYESKSTNVVYTLESEMKSFEIEVLKYYLNSDITKKAATSQTIEITVTDTDITADDGFMYPIEGAIDTAVITFGTATTAIVDVHYTLHNGGVVFNSLNRQTAAGANVLLDPSAADVEVEMVIGTLAGDVLEAETKQEKNYALYAEIYNGDYLDQYFIHKTKPVLDTFPVKQEAEDDQVYTPSWTLLASKAITDPDLSPFYKMIRTKIN